MSDDSETHILVWLIILGALLQLTSCGGKGSGSRYACEDCSYEE